MIQSTHFHDNGDFTIWLATEEIAIEDDLHSGLYRAMDRVCDNCNGQHEYIPEGESELWTCAECFNGRYQLTINVYWEAHLLRNLTVAVRPGMILPIVNAVDDYPQASHLSIGESENWLWEWDENASSFIYHENINLPPIAQPGMYAVLLDVKEE